MGELDGWGLIFVLRLSSLFFVWRLDGKDGKAIVSGLWEPDSGVVWCGLVHFQANGSSGVSKLGSLWSARFQGWDMPGRLMGRTDGW
jgi:hypothetical protein